MDERLMRMLLTFKLVAGPAIISAVEQEIPAERESILVVASIASSTGFKLTPFVNQF